MTALLEVQNLTGGYGDTNVLFNVSTSVDNGEVLGVFGRNGVGKSTFAKLIQGGITPSKGTIKIQGCEVEDKPAFERRNVGIGYMSQTGMVFDDLTVIENLSLGKNRCSPEKYFELFPRLAERLNQPAGTMSGGERKILAFVRAMIEDTNLIVLDEPSEGVQPENIDLMADCILERAEEGAGIMLIEQNLNFLMKVSGKYLGLDAGKTVLSGKR